MWVIAFQILVLSQRKEKREEKRSQERVQEALQKRKDNFETLERERAVLFTSTQTPERTIEEGNIESEAITKTKNINRDKLISAVTKISMGLKRKVELSLELRELEKKMKIWTFWTFLLVVILFAFAFLVNICCKILDKIRT